MEIRLATGKPNNVAHSRRRIECRSNMLFLENVPCTCTPQAYNYRRTSRTEAVVFVPIDLMANESPDIEHHEHGQTEQWLLELHAVLRTTGGSSR